MSLVEDKSQGTDTRASLASAWDRLQNIWERCSSLRWNGVDLELVLIFPHIKILSELLTHQTQGKSCA